MTLQGVPLENTSRTYQTFYTPTDPSLELSTAQTNISHTTEKRTWAHYSGIVSGTIFFVSTVILIACAASKCYTNASDSGNWCRDVCALGPLVSASVVSFIAICILSTLACCTK